MVDIGEVRDQWICSGHVWTRPGDPRSDKYTWIELRARPYEVGLHEAGYRFLAFTGCWFDENDVLQRENLHQWSDHAIFYGPTNIDVEPDGTIRIMAWGANKWTNENKFFASSAMFHPDDYNSALSLMEVMGKTHDEPR